MNNRRETEHRGGVWSRLKGALKRDWTQTKADLSSHGHELHQSVGDTVKQAAGTEPIPPDDLPNLRRHREGDATLDEWNELAETERHTEWGALRDDRKLDEVRNRVRLAQEHSAMRKP